MTIDDSMTIDEPTADVAATGAVAPGFHAEDLHVPERLVAAPAAGVFSPAPPETVTGEGEIVREGQVLGTIEVTGTAVPVTSPHTGFLMGLLAHQGERVRSAQPVAWLRVIG